MTFTVATYLAYLVISIALTVWVGRTLFKNGRPVRQIHLTKVDEFHTGALMMHFMLETIIMGRLMNVDPFDQPGVEEGKILARQYLAEK